MKNELQVSVSSQLRTQASWPLLSLCCSAHVATLARAVSRTDYSA
jgi:hypothetical protein